MSTTYPTGRLYCRNCGVEFSSNVAPCPRPHPGQPYVDCGVGGHVFAETESDREAKERRAWEDVWRAERR